MRSRVSRFRRGTFHVFAAVAMAGVSATTFGQGTPAQTEANLVLTGGRIYQQDAWAEALAVRSGVIVAVGNSASIRPYIGAGTRVIDLKGAPVFPGLHDMHVHPMGAGLQQMECRFRQGSDLAAVQVAIAGCVANRKPGEWITGGQWDATSLRDTVHRSALEAVAPDNPVMLGDLSGHSAWVNTRALELANIDDSTPNPAGGVIERDAQGWATGVLRESAMSLVRRLVPPTTPENETRALKWALDRMVAFGITSLADAAATRSAMRAYATLSDRGELKPRVRGCIMQAPYVNVAARDNPLESANLYARERFKPDCVKITLDGVPTEGHTAAMVEPYADASVKDEARARGILLIPQNTLNRMLIDLDARGITVKMHAAGDAAVRAGLNAIAAARQANGFSGMLHDVGHNSFVQLDDIARARQIGAAMEFSPFIWYPNQITPDVIKAIGPERMKRWVPVRDAVKAGVLVVAGSDWAVVPLVDPESRQAVVPELNPWVGIEGLVTRQAPGGIGEPLGEPISLREAIDIFTVNAARQTGNANRTGRIAPGMLADVIVLDRDPFQVPDTQIHLTKVTLTIIGGEVVHQAVQ